MESRAPRQLLDIRGANKARDRHMCVGKRADGLRGDLFLQQIQDTLSRASAAAMTFTEVFTSSPRTCDSSKTIGQGLETCLLHALTSGRVTVGVKECAKLLSCASEQVMLCLMPDLASSSDVSVHIQQTLIRSFCWENGIRLLTVKNCTKLQKMLSDESAPCRAQDEAITCVLIEKPKGELSADDAFVCNYHDTVFYSDIYPKPVVQLPV